ncbi:MAG TPA: redoxin domain-containing protein, partial [Bryobacteraceae bacterium]|nr:redoxin domain-containing protein [Bryobacteraceae bacterium]
RLLCDVEHKVSEAYGVWVQKNMMGRKYMGVARTTFLIDKDGNIAKIFEKVKPEGHADQVFAACSR